VTTEQEIHATDDERVAKLVGPMSGLLALTRVEERRRIIAWLRNGDYGVHSDCVEAERIADALERHDDWKTTPETGETP
jgi:hypothetical protein